MDENSPKILVSEEKATIITTTTYVYDTDDDGTILTKPHDMIMQ